ncbi:Pentatricopeptide repeat-containing protein, mitochondrial [Vitis vinifera]|uniref:Pentatricopeptide repeat-containing protein, mitochondrial n=1 Tax=Vitis vinifera TaxID=29760 RepID=A0A438H0L8_VITVI|nr:Pentatricopeptide repeat-containing protein, mitochondrial [Vitis vinifera]
MVAIMKMIRRAFFFFFFFFFFFSWKMDSFGIPHNVYTLNVLINSFCHLNRCRHQVTSEHGERDCQPDVVVYGTLIHSLCEWKHVNTLLNEMVDSKIMPNAISLTTVVDALFTYTALMDGHCLRSEMDEAVKVFDMMVHKGCAPNVFSYNTLINGYCKIERMDKAMYLFEEMCRQKLIPTPLWPNSDLVTYRILLDYLCKNCHLDKAMALLKAIEEEAHKLEDMFPHLRIQVKDTVFCKEDDINALGKVISDLNDWLEELEEDMIFLSTPSTYSEMEM